MFLEKVVWLVYMSGLFLVAILIIFILLFKDKKEGFFVSGTEKIIARYDQIYPLDHPKYVTPQQKDFQISLSEHSALDPNMQNRREDIRTQTCGTDVHCFNTAEYKSSPDIINSQIGYRKKPIRHVIYDDHNSEKVVPYNTIAREMRADLFTDIVLPDLFFKRRRVISKNAVHPDEREYQTAIY